MSNVCEKCGARLQVVNTKIIGESRVRYYGCRDCGFRPPGNKHVLPLRYSPPRATSSKMRVVTRAIIGYHENVR